MSPQADFVALAGKKHLPCLEQRIDFHDAPLVVEIFIFESAGLCVVHLGHLHHALLKDHAGRVGSVDVLLAPIDNGYTMSHETLMKVIASLQPQVVIPMHYDYAGGALEAFAALMTERKFDIREVKGSTARFSKVGLPTKQTVVVLRPRGYY